MTSPLREVNVAGSETIADGHGEPQFPGTAIQGRVRVVQRGPKPSWNNRRRRRRGQRLEGPGIALPDAVESRSDGAIPWRTVERESEERGARPPQA
jgi:hypothetical protein